MISQEELRAMALALPEAEEMPHFEKTSFRVRKKIFATLGTGDRLLCVKLNPVDQDVFCDYDAAVIYRVPNKWGLQGWTYVALDRVPVEMLQDILTTAYCTVAPKKLARSIRPDQ